MPGVPAALLTPAGDTGGRLVVHAHGGGFTTGSSLTHRSFGAHVALSAVLELRSEMLPSPAGLVLLSPWLDLAQRGETMRTRASLVHVGDQEVLLSDATRLVENARGKGADAEIKIWPELWHVFHLWAPRLPDANEALRQIGVFIRDRSKTPHC